MSALLTQSIPGQAVKAPVKPTIQKLNFSHEAIIRWMLENPNATQNECAAHFGYSASWLSIIVHSDAFQAKWRELSGKADALVLNDIPAKMRGVASLAIEALGDQVEIAMENPNVLNRSFLLETSETLLSKLGYGAKPAVGTQVNLPPGANAEIRVVSSEALERARAKLAESRANGATVIDGTSERVPDPTTP